MRYTLDKQSITDPLSKMLNHRNEKVHFFLQPSLSALQEKLLGRNPSSFFSPKEKKNNREKEKLRNAGCLLNCILIFLAESYYSPVEYLGEMLRLKEV